MQPKKPATALAPAMERDTVDECPECGGDDIIENWGQGTSECRGCGLVIAERLFDLGSEWRTFAQEEGDDPNRVGGPANPLLEGELGTGIGNGGQGGGRLNAALNRAQQRNAISSSDKTMIQVIRRIDGYCERLSLPGAVSKRAKELFKGYQDHLTLRADGSRTRSLREAEVTEIIAGSLFIACRNVDAERSFKEISALTMVSRKIVGAMVKKMELSVPGAKTVHNATTDDLVTRFCTNLSLPRDIINATAKLSRELHQNVLYGKTYSTVAASSIYVITLLSAPEHKRSPNKIAEVSGVAEVTIKSAYKLMYSHLEKAIPKDFKHPLPFASLPVP